MMASACLYLSKESYALLNNDLAIKAIYIVLMRKIKDNFKHLRNKLADNNMQMMLESKTDVMKM